MKSREQTLEYANRFADFLRLHGLKNREHFAPQSTETLKRMYGDQIESGLELFRQNVKPHHTSIAEDRPRRTLSIEIARLWTNAWLIYREFCFSQLPLELQEISGLSPEDRQNFKQLAEHQFRDIALPLLKEYESPGDDFYLLVAHAISCADEEKVVEAIAHLKPIPPHSDHVVYAIFSLLIQAQRYQEQSKVAEAYTCIIDANALIGMAKGANFVIERLPQASIKRHGIVNNARKNQKNDRYKLLVQSLFYSLAPRDDKHRRQPWNTATEAMEMVWDAFQKQTKSTKAAKSALGYDLVLTICRNLQARDTTEGLLSLDIHAEVIEVSISDNPDKTSGV